MKKVYNSDLSSFLEMISNIKFIKSLKLKIGSSPDININTNMVPLYFVFDTKFADLKQNLKGIYCIWHFKITKNSKKGLSCFFFTARLIPLTE